MTAPIFRAVEQHTGKVAEPPSKFWGALSEADNFCAERNEVHELRTRVDELDLELGEAKERNFTLVQRVAEMRLKLERLEAEKNMWMAVANCGGVR